MLKTVRNCFSDTKVNLLRQSEVDIAKGLAIIFMVLCHVFETLVWFFNPESSIAISEGIYDNILGGSLSAPVFMFFMGLGLCYSKKNNAADILRRALRLTGVVVLLELFRTAIPGLIEWLLFRDPECIEYLYLLFCSDILQFAVLSLCLIALFKKFRISSKAVLIVAVVFSIVGQALQGVSTNSHIGDIFSGFIWHSYENAFFPLLNWFIFPAAGMVFGEYWLRIKDKETFFKIFTPICWCISVLYFASMIFVDRWYFLSSEYYYGLGTLDALFALVICIAMLGLGYYFNKWLGRVAKWVASMGVRVNSIYCIHWTLLSFMYLVLITTLESFVPQWSIIPISAVIIAVSDLLSRFYKKFINKNKKAKA